MRAVSAAFARASLAARWCRTLRAAAGRGRDADADLRVARRRRSPAGSLPPPEARGAAARHRVPARRRMERRHPDDRSGLQALLRAGRLRDGVDRVPADAGGHVPGQCRGREDRHPLAAGRMPTAWLSIRTHRLWGTSAGGHLAAVAALSPRGMFEGADNLNQSSAVQCVLDAYGPTMFAAMDAQTEQEKATLQPLAAGSVHAPPMRGGVVTAGRRGRASGRGAGRRRARRPGAMPHDAPRRRNRGWWARRSRPCPKVARGEPADLRHSRSAAVPDHARPRRQLRAPPQSVLLYEALAAAGPTSRSGSSTVCRTRSSTAPISTSSPARSAWTCASAPRAGRSKSASSGGVFDVARAFFQQHLQAELPSR